MKRFISSILIVLFLSVVAVAPLPADDDVITWVGPNCFIFAVSPFWIQCQINAQCSGPGNRWMYVSTWVSSGCALRLGEVWAYQSDSDEILAWGKIVGPAGLIGDTEESQACNYDDYADAPFSEPCY